jgi:hypothetical protein
MKFHTFGQTTLFTICLTLIGLAPHPAQAQPASSVAYSADFVFETADMAQTGRIYVSAGKERREALMEGITMITIRREDLGKTWMLMPDEQMYMEFGHGQKNPSGMTADNPADYDVQMTEVGPEVLDGLETIKQKVIMTAKDGSKMGGFWWTTPEGITIKMDMLAVDEGEKMRLKQVLSNVVIGEPEPALFEIPAGYENMMMGMGMGMGMAMQMPGLPKRN